MAFDVEQMWEQHWPGIYSRLSLRCVENHPVDSVQNEIAWARYAGGHVCIRVEIERLDVTCRLGPAAGEPEWYLQTVVRLLVGQFQPTPSGGIASSSIDSGACWSSSGRRSRNASPPSEQGRRTRS